MGHINTEYVETLLNEKRPKVFVETGTFKGGIPQRMLMDGTFDKWDKVYTIELNNEMCKIASKRYSLFEKGQPFNTDTDEKDESFNKRKEFFGGKLVLIQGDSGEKLEEILSEVDEPIVFWLDAHAGSKEGYERGEVDCPLLQELELIKNHKIKNHFIAVDDANMLGQLQVKDGETVCDYTSITMDKVKEKMSQFEVDYTIDITKPFGQDMLVATPRETIFAGSNDNWWS
tara:strand:+ start:2770 stop:3459 length:690 start_codon:yes stop_codon:yes gene_type:complete